MEWEDLFFNFAIEQERDYFKKFYNLIEESIQHQSVNIKKEYEGGRKEVNLRYADRFDDHYVDLSYELSFRGCYINHF